MSRVESTDQTVIIVVQYSQPEHGELTMGILVDEVLEVLSIASEQIAPPPNFGSGALVLVSAEDVGGSKSRTTRLYVGSGRVTISSQGEETDL